MSLPTCGVALSEPDKVAGRSSLLLGKHRDRREVQTMKDTSMKIQLWKVTGTFPEDGLAQSSLWKRISTGEA